MIKNDLKYLIKKIIIGIGIALGIMFFKPYIAFADTYLSVSVDSNGSYSTVPSDFDVKKATLTLDSTFTGDTTPVFLNLYVVSRYSSYWNNYILFRNLKNNSYLLSTFRNDTVITDLNLSVNENGQYGVLTTASFFYNNLLLNKNGDQNENSTATSFSKIIFTTNEGNIFYGLNDFNKSSYSALNINQDYEIVDTNISNLTINNIPYEDYYGPTIPENYQEIDMFGKYAVLFYPTDYRNIPLECTEYGDSVTTDENGNVTITPNNICLKEEYKFNFLYNGYFNTAFVDINKMDKVINPVEQLPFITENSVYDLPLYITPKKFKGGIIFYNNQLSQITDDNGNVNLYYDKGKIYYDPTLLNYFYIENPNSNIKENITYIDNNGDTQTSIVTKIPQKNQTDSDSAQDIFDLLNSFQTNNHGLSSIISSPLSFINQLNEKTCIPLSIPIPYSNGQNIQLPCMTPIYQDKFGAIYNIYSTIIIGITAYHVCVNLFSIVKGIKNPDDDRIEVLEL